MLLSTLKIVRFFLLLFIHLKREKERTLVMREENKEIQGEITTKIKEGDIKITKIYKLIANEKYFSKKFSSLVVSL